MTDILDDFFSSNSPYLEKWGFGGLDDSDATQISKNLPAEIPAPQNFWYFWLQKYGEESVMLSNPL